MIVVTGASGFIGRHLARELAHRFPTERTRLFDLAPAKDVLPLHTEFVSGAIEDPIAVGSVVRGAKLVVHLAAKVQPASRAHDDLFRVNVEGARTVYAGAVAAGCHLFIHMSSAGVYGPPRAPSPFRETDATQPETPYQRTKFAAEEELRRIDHQNTTLNMLRPAGVYGPGSYLEIPAYASILKRRVTIEQRGGVIVHPTHVTDVVGAILALIEHPAPHGSIFNVGGERPILHQDFQALVADALGVRRLRLVLPPLVARPLTAIAGAVLDRIGRPKPLLHAFSRGDVVSAAVDDRLFRQRYPSVPICPLRYGIQEHVAWARAQSLL